MFGGLGGTAGGGGGGSLATQSPTSSGLVCTKAVLRKTDEDFGCSGKSLTALTPEVLIENVVRICWLLSVWAPDCSSIRRSEVPMKSLKLNDGLPIELKVDVLPSASSRSSVAATVPVPVPVPLCDDDGGAAGSEDRSDGRGGVVTSAAAAAAAADGDSTDR